METELAFELASDLHPPPQGGYTQHQIVEALGGMTAAIEITGRRVPPPADAALGPWVIAGTIPILFGRSSFENLLL